MDTISLLQKYGEDVGGAERTLALIAARWLAAEPTAVSDPLLTDLLAKAQFHNGANFRMSERSTFLKPKASIMEYFGSKATATATTATTTTATTATTNSPVKARIYCDGACSANGRKSAKAGFGAVLIHADGTEETVSEALGSEPQTNQRAELRGLQWAFTKALSLREGAEIYTDSEYAMKCFLEWGAGWAARGWRKADGKEVLHQDILKPMWEMWKHRGTKIRLYHVSAHTGKRDIHSMGNAKADQLAVASIH